MSNLTSVIDRPIIFSGAMVRAILEGRKTQTRRVIKPQLEERVSERGEQGLTWPHQTSLRAGQRDWVLERMADACPYGFPGGRLWLRETWAVRASLAGPRIEYQADGASTPLPAPHEHDIRDEGGKVDLTRYVADRWRPSIHMPRWASRITLEIGGVRVERVQEISHEDARAEGIRCFIPPYPFPADWPRNEAGKYTPSYGVEYAADRSEFARTARAAFAELWDSINGPRGYGWQANPWVWVVEFGRV